jgi:hypothetical protein
MIGTYKIPADRIGEMKGAFRFSFIKFIIITDFIFILILIIRGEPDMLSSMLMVTGVFACVLLLFLIVNAFQHRPLYNTVIQLTENEIIRSGEGLLSVHLRYHEIGRIITKDIGTLLVKKGIAANINLYTSKYAYSSESGIILIPLSIENYLKIVMHVKEKAKQID